MTTKIDAGAQNPNPAAGVKTRRKAKVPPLMGVTTAVTTGATANPPANPPVGSAAGDALLAGHAALPAVTALIARRAATAVSPLVAGATPDALRNKRVMSQSREPVIALIANLIRTEPTVAPAQTADELDAGMAYVADLRQAASSLQRLLTDLGGATRLVMVGLGSKARLVLTVAEHLAKTDQSVAVGLTPIRQAMKRGAAVVSTQNVATRSAQTLARSEKTLERSQQKVAVAQRRADLAKEAQGLAEARRTGAMPAPAPAPTPSSGTPHTG